MASMASQLIEEVTAHAQSDSLVVMCLYFVSIIVTAP